MTTSNIVNSIGLVCDIIGAALIWRYGLPETINRGGENYIAVAQLDEAEIAKAKRFDCIARFGIILLVGGFLLQLGSNFL